MPCKPAALCSSLLSGPKKKRDAAIAAADVVEPVKRGRENGIVAAETAAPSPIVPSSSAAAAAKVKPARRSSSKSHRDFLRAVGDGGKPVSFFEGVPSCEEAYLRFVQINPRFSETRALDELRQREYSHLEEDELACLDYCGFGLFSHAQQADMAAEEEGLSSAFALSEISANLWSHALFGASAEGTMEDAIRTRIMQFLNVPSSEYSMVFTASRGSTFKLLADAYPWSGSPRLVTMYDYESESVGWMEQRALDEGARVYRARFRWPLLRVCSAELKKELLAGSGKKTKGKPTGQQVTEARHSSASSARLSVASWLDRVSMQQQHHIKREKQKGLFVFPVQSRVSGSKYSYQWMSLAQQNHWHVLLDASALGPKDMDSLGLSLFRPDFITASFYRLFGGDPSGFGCLLIKNSVAQSIQDPSGAPVSGMVHITPLKFPSQRSFSSSSTSEDAERYEEGRMVSAFSGPMPAIDEIDIPSPPELEADENCSVAYDDTEVGSVGELSHSPFSEDGNENPFSADARQVYVAKDTIENPFAADAGQEEHMVEDSFNGLLCEGPTNPPILENGHHLSGRRNGPPARSRIKGLCSGLLNLHSGRVGNSGDNVEEDASVRKDVAHDLSEDSDRKPPSLKRVAFQIKDLEAQGRPIPKGAFMSKVQHSRHYCDEPGEQIADRLVLVFNKRKEEHLAVDNGQACGRHRVNECDQMSLANDIIDNRAEEEYMYDLDQGGLETIEEMEIEIECPNGSEGESEQGAVRSSPLQANNSKMSILEKMGPEITPLQKENVICRETEGGFRLLGCRNTDLLSLSKIFTAGSGDESFASRSIASDGRNFSSMSRSIGSESDEEPAEGTAVEEPQLLCKSLDHADMMGLNKTSVRLRYLINWLVSSLLTLRHSGNDISLVRIYGPQVRYDRGASIAFNVLDEQGRLVQPDLVRTLADHLNISLGVGYLRNIYCRGNFLEAPSAGSLFVDANGAPSKSATFPSRVEVVTAALGLVSDFRDVYKLWSFVAKFLDPRYVEREVCSLQPSSSSSDLRFISEGDFTIG